MMPSAKLGCSCSEVVSHLLAKEKIVGSIPASCSQGPMEQFGVLATLSRWRSRVQVPLGSHVQDGSN